MTGNWQGEDRQDPAGQPGNGGEGQQKSEEETVSSVTRMSARLIYEAIRRDGEEELDRPNVSLIYSGLAAGQFQNCL